MHITAGVANQSGVRLENLTSNSPASGNASKFLIVDGNGYVYLANYASGAREAASEGLWQRKGQFLQSLQGESIVIGSNVSRTPPGYKLFVEDGILTERVRVAVKTTADWSDNVFAPAYRLPTVAEVARYIQQNKHLPGVPSAAEMVERGNDLHQTNVLLLGKIEELMLYTIQLEKDNREQAAKLKTMEKKHEQELAEIKQLLRDVIKRK